MNVHLMKSPNHKKKFRVIFMNGRTVDFGAANYSNYTIHQNPIRKNHYVNRHRARENWTKAGMYTAGFWSRWLLWSQPTMALAKKLIKKKFNLIIHE